MQTLLNRLRGTGAADGIDEYRGTHSEYAPPGPVGATDPDGFARQRSNNGFPDQPEDAPYVRCSDDACPCDPSFARMEASNRGLQRAVEANSVHLQAMTAALNGMRDIIAADLEQDRAEQSAQEAQEAAVESAEPARTEHGYL
jgi:hypothetical protein